MDLYSTHTLNGVVDSLKRTPAFFLNTFFTTVQNSDVEEISFDVEIDGKKRRLAPYVHPLIGGKLVESRGFQTKTFKPPYVKDKRAHDANRPFKRTAGEQIGGNANVTPAQRQQLNLTRDLRDQTDMVTRRMEQQSVEAIRTGKVTVTGEGFDTVVVDFGRDANLTITKTGGTKWGDPGIDPLKDIEDWSLLVLQKSGSTVKNIVMDVNAWRAFRSNTNLEKRLDLARVKSGIIDLGVVPDHVQYKGSDGTFDYWVYTDWYIDETTQVETPFLPSGTVCGVADIQGVRHFGAIKDEDAGYQAREYFSKSWVVPDPSVRFLLMQSAPLMVPYRPNSSFCATVL
jgi:hypothetical protein